MQISFTPQRSDETLNLSRSGDVLTINGEAFDFSDIPEGGTCPREAVACDWLASDVVRDGGVIRLTLILPHGADAPEETLFPEPATPDGGLISGPINGRAAVPPGGSGPETARDDT